MIKIFLRDIFYSRVWPAPTDGIRGSYSSGSEDGSRPGVFYINVRRSKDKYVF